MNDTYITIFLIGTTSFFGIVAPYFNGHCLEEKPLF